MMEKNKDMESADAKKLLFTAGACCDERIGPDTFDPEKNWKRFKRKSMFRRKISYTFSGAVATILLLIALGIYMGKSRQTITLFAATQAKPEITLQYGPHSPLVISSGLIDLTRPEYDPSQQYIIETPAGAEIQICLPDSSSVRLNAQSKLTYRQTPRERSVSLSGEGYFHVRKAPARPFLIQTGDVIAKVLGTSFNIRNYEQEQLQISLINGSLSIETRHAPRETVMKPGEEADLLKDGQFRIKQTDTTRPPSWTEGYFSFDNAPLSDIMRELGRSYNLTVKTLNTQVTAKRFHFKCKRSLEIDRIIDMLNEQGAFKVVRKENTIFIK